MLQVKTKMKLYNIILITAILTCFQISAKPDGIIVKATDNFMFEVVDKISIRELLALKPAKHVLNNPIGFLDVRAFGYEWYPNDGKMKVSFLVSAGLGDLGEIPLTIKLWVPLESNVVYDEVRTKKKQQESNISAAVFCQNGADKSSDKCVTIIISKIAEVYVDEHLLGKLDL